MVTTITVPKDKAKPNILEENLRDQTDLLVSGRALVEQTQLFIEDPNQTELINWGEGPGKRGLPKKTFEQWKKNGLGTQGIFTVLEPADLKLYRSYIRAPLSMPKKPEVSVILVDYATGNPVTRYQEGWIMVKAKCPTGKEAWFSVSVPVPNLMMCYMGLAWGIPKYVADEMTVTPTKSVVKYEGEVRFSMELKPGPVKNEATLQARGAFGMDNAVTFFPRKDGSTCLVNWFLTDIGARDGVVEWQTGMVKVYVRPQDPWAGLIAVGSTTPGVWQRVIDVTGIDFIWQKIKC